MDKDSFEYEKIVDYMPGGKIGRGTYSVDGKEITFHFDNSYRIKHHKSEFNDIAASLSKVESNTEDGLKLVIVYHLPYSPPFPTTSIFRNTTEIATITSDADGRSEIDIIRDSIILCENCTILNDDLKFDAIQFGDIQKMCFYLSDIIDDDDFEIEIIHHERYYDNKDTLNFYIKKKRRNSFELHTKQMKDTYIKYNSNTSN